MIPTEHSKFIDTVVSKLQNDERIIGIGVGGSYIDEVMDEFSDLDFVIVIKKESFSEVMKERFDIAKKFGNYVAGFTGEHVGEPKLIICLYKSPLIHIDFKFITIEEFYSRVEDPKIVWEREGILTNTIMTTKSSYPIPDIQWIEDRFWIWIHYFATKVGRGELFEAIDFITFLRGKVLGNLIHMKNGALPRRVRQIEFVANEWIERLSKTIPCHNAKSCIDAGKEVVKIYKELREFHKSEVLIINSQAEDIAILYLYEIEERLNKCEC